MSDRPNILYVFTDQQHFAALSAQGNPHLHTPAMDSVFEEGVRFTNCYATDPVCAPCRSSMFYGRMPCETGVFDNELWPLESLPTVGQWLSEKAGYRSVYCGKWHLFQSETYHIPGFEVIGTGANCEGNYSDAIITRACDAFLHRHAKHEPFLLVASYQQPHDICGWMNINGPYSGPLRYPEIAGELPPIAPNFHVDFEEPALIKEHRRTRAGWKNDWSEEHWRYYEWCYYRQVEMVDAEIGRLLESLRASPHADNTVVIFASDHGECLGRHGLQTKSVLYDEAAKIPLAIWWPKALPQGRHRSQVVSALDFMATMCDIAEVSPPEEACRGRSLMPAARGSEEPVHEYVVAACQGNRGRMVRTQRFKYIVYRDDPVELLFDMERDPDETRNLAGDPARSVDLLEHRRMLRQFESQMVYAPGVQPFFSS